MSPEAQILADDIRALSPHYSPKSSGTSTGVVAYFLILFLAGGLGAPTGIAAIPIGYFLKDNLHLSPVELALFVAIAGAPAYFGFLPGFVRDRFRPRVMGDRALPDRRDLRACRVFVPWSGFNQLLDTSICHLSRRHRLSDRHHSGAGHDDRSCASASDDRSFECGIRCRNLYTGNRLSTARWMARGPCGRARNVHHRGMPNRGDRRAGVLAPTRGARIRTGEAWSRDRNDGGMAIGAVSTDLPAAAIFFLWNFGPGWGTPCFTT